MPVQNALFDKGWISPKSQSCRGLSSERTVSGTHWATSSESSWLARGSTYGNAQPVEEDPWEERCYPLTRKPAGRLAEQLQRLNSTAGEPSTAENQRCSHSQGPTCGSQMWSCSWGAATGLFTTGRERTWPPGPCKPSLLHWSSLISYSWGIRSSPAPAYRIEGLCPEIRRRYLTPLHLRAKTFSQLWSPTSARLAKVSPMMAQLKLSHSSSPPKWDFLVGGKSSQNCKRRTIFLP